MVLACVLSCVLGCVCGVWCVVVCVACVARLVTRKTPVCRFKTPPCVRSKRLRVYWHNARMLNTSARFASTHGSVLNLHMGGGRGGGLLSLSRPFSLSLLSFLLSLFRRSLPLFSFSFSSFSLSVTMTVITRPVGSLCTRNSDLP